MLLILAMNVIPGLEQRRSFELLSVSFDNVMVMEDAFFLYLKDSIFKRMVRSWNADSLFANMLCLCSPMPAFFWIFVNWSVQSLVCLHISFTEFL